MGRGIFFGALWGLIVGGVVLSVASLLGEVPVASTQTREAPEASQLEVPAGSGFDQAGVDRPVSPPAIQPPSEPSTDAPLVTSPEAPAPLTLGTDVTASASVPQTGGVDALAPPPAGASESGVVLRAEEAPSADSTVTIATPEAETTLGAEATTPAAPLPEPEAPVPTAAPEVAEEAPEATLAPAPDAPVEAAESESLEIPEAPEADAPEALTEAPAPTPRPQASAGGFGNRAEGVTVNRPTQGALAEAEAAETAEPEPDLPAIVRNALRDDWAGPDDRPLFSFIIIDEAGDAAFLGALASFDGPLTFALPATASEAAVARYRTAGHEVAVIADIPEGAQPADIEVAMEGYMRAVPSAVAVLDGTLSGFRGDRQVARQVVDILAESGHGLVTVSQGLDAASQIAAQADIPAGTIYRDLDAEGQNNTVIRRFLDQAAFRAQQDGSVILLARMRPETISALLIWHQQDRAERVNLAPLSATLLER